MVSCDQNSCWRFRQLEAWSSLASGFVYLYIDMHIYIESNTSNKKAQFASAGTKKKYFHCLGRRWPLAAKPNPSITHNHQYRLSKIPLVNFLRNIIHDIPFALSEKFYGTCSCYKNLRWQLCPPSFQKFRTGSPPNYTMVHIGMYIVHYVYRYIYIYKCMYRCQYKHRRRYKSKYRYLAGAGIAHQSRKGTSSVSFSMGALHSYCVNIMIFSQDGMTAFVNLQSHLAE